MMPKSLPTAEFGRTGITVTRLGFGTATAQAIDLDVWQSVLNAVLDEGINFIDTAHGYGMAWNRPAEEMIGKYLAARREEFYLTTKGGSADDGSWTKEELFRQLHGSLSRLKMDDVDVLLLHNPSVKDCEEGDLVQGLEDMRRQGKVRWIGISTSLPEVSTFLEWGVFNVFQLPYSVLEREHEHAMAQAAAAGIGIIVRGGVAQGEPGIGQGEPDRWQRYSQSRLDELRPSSESRTTFLLRHTMTNVNAHTNIVGTTNLDHLHENVQAALRGILPDDLNTEINRRLAGIDEGWIEDEGASTATQPA